PARSVAPPGRRGTERAPRRRPGPARPADLAAGMGVERQLRAGARGLHLVGLDRCRPQPAVAPGARGRKAADRADGAGRKPTELTRPGGERTERTGPAVRTGRARTPRSLTGQVTGRSSGVTMRGTRKRGQCRGGAANGKEAGARAAGGGRWTAGGGGR